MLFNCHFSSDWSSSYSYHVKHYTVQGSFGRCSNTLTKINDGVVPGGHTLTRVILGRLGGGGGVEGKGRGRG